jgi:hypothetical protein
MRARFIRGLPPKKAMDIGVHRKVNLKQFKYFSDIDEREIKDVVTSLGFNFIRLEESGFSLMIIFSNRKHKLIFDISIDDDTASYRHSMEWENLNSKGGFDYQEPRWTLNGEQSDIIRCLKRRIKKYLKDH